MSMPVNVVSIRNSHVGEPDDQPDQQRETAKLNEGFKVLNRVQPFAESLHFARYNLSRLLRDAPNQALRKVGDALRILSDRVSKGSRHRHARQQNQARELEVKKCSRRMSEARQFFQ